MYLKIQEPESISLNLSQISLDDNVT